MDHRTKLTAIALNVGQAVSCYRWIVTHNSSRQCERQHVLRNLTKSTGMTDYSSAEYSDDYYADYPVPAASYVESFIPDESEEESLFFSEWNEQVPASKNDADAVSLCVWPNVDRIVNLKRLDVYQCHEPKAHQASSNPTESLKIRRSQNWFALRSIFFMDQALAFTKELHVETGGGPIRRQRVRNLHYCHCFCS